MEVSDSSTVVIDISGEVQSVLASSFRIPCKNTNGLSGTEAYDAAVLQMIRDTFREYHCDDDEKAVDVQLTEVKIQACQLSKADAGELILVYYLTPELSYRVIYKGKAAEIAAERGLPTEQEGISEPPVYAAVYLQP